MFDIAVLVLTYNAEWTKLKRTLKSILMQKNINFQIVIADDGSSENHENKIISLFNENRFCNYVFVNNPVNQGTVKNTISGLEKIEAEYVKDISPGDYLYDENTLYEFLKVINQKKKEVYFGNAVYYYEDDGDVIFYDKKAPNDVSVYKKGNEKKIKKNYILKHDYILGAALVLKTEVYLKYLHQIEPFVKYTEDCSFICMVADDIVPIFIDENLIWYEYGDGISTSSDKKWGQIIKNENMNTYNYLVKNNKIKSYIYDIVYSSSKLKKLLLRLIYCPSLLLKPKSVSVIKRVDEDKLLLISEINNE